MSIGYLHHLLIMLTMLITAIHFIISQDNNFSRRDVLIRILKNADKHARFNERLTFLCECRRNAIYPRFIHSLVSPTVRLYICLHSFGHYQCNV